MTQITIVNSVGCTMTGEFSNKKLAEFAKAGWLPQEDEVKEATQ